VTEVKASRLAPPPRCAECGREYLPIPEQTAEGLCLLCTLAEVAGGADEDLVQEEE
jgi:hypothetical protein